MNEKAGQDKSPRSPVHSLADSIEYVRKLHKSIGRATVDPKSAAVALGYKGLNGAALTTLGTLSQYELIERSRGTVAVTPLALRILHPTTEDQKRQAMRESALSPKVFRDLAKDFSDCTADVLTSHLVQSGFNVERAKRAATVFVTNKSVVDISSWSIIDYDETDDKSKFDTQNEDEMEIKATRGPRMLADYTLPLGPNEATIKIEGEKLSVSDFDELIDFIQFCRKQFERRDKTQAAPQDIGPKSVKTQDTDRS